MAKVRIAHMTYLGNCILAAEELERLLSPRHEVEVVSIHDGASGSGGADMLIICSPVRMGKLSPRSAGFLRSLKRSPPMLYTLVLTHASDLEDPKLGPRKAAERAMRRLDRMGHRSVAEPTYLKVSDIEGRLVDGYEGRLRELSEGLLRIL